MKREVGIHLLCLTGNKVKRWGRLFFKGDPHVTDTTEIIDPAPGDIADALEQFRTNPEVFA